MYHCMPARLQLLPHAAPAGHCSADRPCLIDVTLLTPLACKALGHVFGHQAKLKLGSLCTLALLAASATLAPLACQKLAVYTATPTHTSARHGMAWRPALLHISQQGTGCHTCMPHGSEWRMRCGMMHRARRGWWPPAQGCLATLACAAHHASTQQETRPHHT